MEQRIETQYISWVEFHRDTKQLVNNLVHKKWSSIIAVSRGGLIPASIIARELSIFSIDTICPYVLNGGSIEIIKKSVIKDTDSVLIVDEFVSSGRLFKEIRKYISRAMFASVYVTEKAKSFVDFYSKELGSRDVFFPWDTDIIWSEPILPENNKRG